MPPRRIHRTKEQIEARRIANKTQVLERYHEILKHCPEYKKSQQEYQKWYRDRRLKNYYATDPEHRARVLARAKAAYARRKTNPQDVVVRRVREKMRLLLRSSGLGNQYSSNFGCTAKEFKAHLESLWTPGMSWENYGHKGWHIDHIKPCSSFDLTIKAEAQACFHYKNTQPLWGKLNMSKRNNPAPDPLLVEGYKLIYG